MCLPKAPKIDMPDAPLAQQDAKTPDMATSRRKQGQGNIAGGTLLTGPSAATGGATNTGAASLLGQ